MIDHSDESLLIDTRQRLAEEAYERLRDAIVKGQLAPDDRLVTRKLTKFFGVSRTPVREALTRLEHEGLVVSSLHRGYCVRRPTLAETRQVYEVRQVVEGLAGKLAAQRASDEELNTIRKAVDTARDLIDSGSPGLRVQNELIHRLQVEAAHNQFLEHKLREIWAIVDLARGTGWEFGERAIVIQREHEGFIDALIRRDAEEAQRLNELHVLGAWNAVAGRHREWDSQRNSEAAI
jgi:DNA-binding GntR family transcriptional regulator